MSILNDSYFFDAGVGFGKRVYQMDQNYLSYFGLSRGFQLNPKMVMGARLNWSMDWQPDMKNYLEGLNTLKEI